MLIYDDLIFFQQLSVCLHMRHPKVAPFHAPMTNSSEVFAHLHVTMALKCSDIHSQNVCKISVFSEFGPLRLQNAFVSNKIYNNYWHNKLSQLNLFISQRFRLTLVQQCLTLFVMEIFSAPMEAPQEANVFSSVMQDLLTMETPLQFVRTTEAGRIKSQNVWVSFEHLRLFILRLKCIVFPRIVADNNLSINNTVI